MRDNNSVLYNTGVMKMNQLKGFTILEVMMVIVVVGILSMVAIPSIGQWINNQRIKSHMYDFLNALGIARSEAIKRKTPVSICSSNNGASCAGSNDWKSGWIIFQDSDGDGVVDVADGDVIISVADSISGATGNNTANAIEVRLLYKTDGSLDDTSLTVPFRIAFCDNRGEDDGRQVNVGLVGRASAEGGTNESISDCNAPS